MRNDQTQALVIQVIRAFDALVTGWLAAPALPSAQGRCCAVRQWLVFLPRYKKVGTRAHFSAM